MRRLVLLTLLLSLVWSPVARADFVSPASLEIAELRPSEFEVVLTLPLVQGRILKVKPVFPDIFNIQGKVKEQAISGSVKSTWLMTCNTEDLAGTAIGVQGLLGTTQEILLTIKTLDGRSYRQALRATQSFYIIPKPPAVMQLALQAGLQGMQQVLRRFELVLFIIVLLMLGLHWQSLLAVSLIFALAQMIGQGLSVQNWMMVSPFWARAFCSLITLLLLCGSLNKDWLPAKSLKQRLWIPLFLLGLLYGASQSGTITDWILSTKEQYMALAFGAVGVLGGFGLLSGCVQEGKLALRNRRMPFWITYGAGILAAALFWYEASAPAFVNGIVPDLPLIFWVAAGCLGLWCRAQEHLSRCLVLTAGSFFGLGLIFSFTNMSVPLLSLGMLIFLTYLGVTLLFSLRRQGWFQMLIAACGTFYYGFAISDYMRDSTALPVAHVVGTAILLSFTFFICYQIMENSVDSIANFPVRVCGLLASALAIFLRFQEYKEWFQGEILPELVMGSLQIPVLTVLLLVLATLAWPRRRRFQVTPAGGPSVTHWILLGLAFFLFPHGTFSLRNPFYTPRAPTAVEARHIMGRLLADTYLAFNVKDEDTAFDRLEANLSEDLIADVYLDSRRRLSAGTRQGAKVTVKTIQVKSVDPALSKSLSSASFTYPCQWVVTARVKHLQHVHDRQNIYLGELTIGIEDDKWKITRLVLKNEERIIKPWQKA